MAVFPSTSVRTKDWGTEVLTDSDLEAQLDLLHAYFAASLNATTGHAHTGASNQGPKLSPANLVIASQAQGDILYASSASAWARLGAGTSGQFLKTNGASANPSWATLAVYVPRSTWNNLSVSYTNATTVAVTADELVLQDSSFNSARITAVNESIAITTSGAGGLVSALSEAANTIYYIWIARKSSDGTVDGFLSTSATFATVLGQLDSGYDQAALVSAVGNNNSSNFISFKQTGRKYIFTTGALMASGTLGSTPSTWASIDLTPANMSTNPGFVAPALSDYCFGASYIGDNISCFINNISSETATADMTNGYEFGQVSGGLFHWEFMVLTADTLYTISSSSTYKVYLHGFEINKLG